MDLGRHLDKAEEMLRRGNAEYAAELCDEVLELKPNEPRAATLMVEACCSRGSKGGLAKLSAASSALAARFGKLIRSTDGQVRARRRAFMKDPFGAETGLAWGGALEQAGYAASARAVFTALARAEPPSGCAAKRAGALAAANGEIEDALDLFRLALEANPRDTEALRMRKNLAAEHALQTKRYEEVESSRDLAVDADEFLKASRGLDTPAEEGEEDGPGPPSGEIPE